MLDGFCVNVCVDNRFMACPYAVRAYWFFHSDSLWPFGDELGTLTIS